MSDTTRFTIGEVAAMVGMSAHTIRAWEKRHQILTPQRTASGQRRYTMADVELLQQVKLAVASRHLSLKLAVGFAQGRVEEPLEAPVDSSAPVLGHDVSVEPPGLWRTVADLLPELIVVLDDEGAIVDANIACARAAGVLRGRLRGTRLIDLVDPYDRAKAVRVYRPRPAQRRGWELNLRTRMLTGLVSFDCWPVREGGHRRVVMVGRDVTARGEELWVDQVDPPTAGVDA
ncbi:MAG TPA: MerR family transcriptional regulator [Candidatus Dormibacteraeota bacterium]|jgi:PAS domain S-box-containing protein|nr:MerR family transcriptional regulator [Candidatus Dormibacteraeota bacterium]